MSHTLLIAIVALALVQGGASQQSSGQSSGSTSSSSSSGKPDIWLGFLDWESMKPMKPFTDQFKQTVSPYTQQLSQLLLERMPGASNIYNQLDQAGNQMTSQFNPTNFLGGQLGGIGGGGGGGSSGSSGQLSDLLNPSNFLGGGGGGAAGTSSQKPSS